MSIICFHNYFSDGININRVNEKQNIIKNVATNFHIISISTQINTIVKNMSINNEMNEMTDIDPVTSSIF